MPTFRFHGTEPEKLFLVNKALHTELSTLYNVPSDHITIEIIHSLFLFLDSVTENYPLVEVIAFKRNTELEDQVAKCVHKYLAQAGYTESELYFNYVEPRNYYGNGEHY